MVLAESSRGRGVSGATRAWGVPSAILLVVLLSGLLRWSADSAPFGGDQAQYGRVTIELTEALGRSPGAWVHQLIHGFPYKPNGLMWLGQWFVPAGHAAGSVDASLLLVPLLAQILTLVIFFRAALAVAPGAIPAAAAGAISIAAAPLFLAMGHQYYVEPLQTLAAAWFLLIAVRSPRWPRSFVLLQLLAATAFAVSTKETEPVFCIWAGLFALAGVMRSTEPRTTMTSVAWWTTALAAAAWGVATTAWYVSSFAAVLDHVRGGAFHQATALFWGKDEGYVAAVRFWALTMRDELFAPGLWLLWAAAVGFALIAVWKRRTKVSWIDACAALSGLQIVTVVLVFAISPTRQARYLLPVIPFVAFLLHWALVRLNLKIVTAVVLVLVTVQAGRAHWSDWERLRSDRSGSLRRQMLEAIVSRTCAPSGAATAHNILAVESGIAALGGDWLGPEPANYEVAKRSYGHVVRPCVYDYAGNGFFGAAFKPTWSAVLSSGAHYVITTDPREYELPPLAFNESLSRENHPLLLAALDGTSHFLLEAPAAAAPGIRFYRRRDDELTGQLFERAGNVRLGDGEGRFERTEDGILIHPGVTRPTAVDFHLEGRFGLTRVVAFIAPLDAQGMSVPEAGKAGVDIRADGTLLIHREVDRRSPIELHADLRNVKTLTVSVDNGNGKTWWDWLTLAAFPGDDATEQNRPAPAGSASEK
jgi:hypothetical protein